MERQPLWVGTSRRADAWRELGASEFVCRAIQYGIVDMPRVPFEGGWILPEVPQTEEDRVFAQGELEDGCRPGKGIYEEIAREEADRVVAEGKMVSSAFVVWQGDGEARKGRFVVNFARQSKHWPKGSVKMETLPSFGLEMQKGDTLMSWDVKSGYRHFYLHPCMRDMFVFHYGGRFYRCIALPFGWGRSVLWFTKLMRPLVQHIRSKLGYRLLPWIDDFLCAPTDGRRPATKRDCRKAGAVLDVLLDKLGIRRHESKGCWDGATRLEHLGFLLDTEQMRVFVTDAKVAKMRQLSQQLLLSVQRNRRLVSAAKLRHFCGVAVSLTLALPLARFYTRSLYWDASIAGRRAAARDGATEPAKSERAARSEATSARGGARSMGRMARSGKRVVPPEFDKVRLSRQSIRDLRYWRSLARGEGRDLIRLEADRTMHSDAADVGYGGTLGLDTGAGQPGLWEGRGLWEARDRMEGITLRELKAVRLLLQRHFAEYVQDPSVQRLLLHEDNQAVVYVLNSMVSASRPMMAELRKLQALMAALGVKIEARWLPSAVNRFADGLSRTWDPGDTGATSTLLRSAQDAYQLEELFPFPPIGEHPIAREKHLRTQMDEDWGDGKARLFNPPFDLLPVVIRKLEAEGGCGVVVAPRWRAQSWYGRLVRLADRIHVLQQSASEPLFTRDVNPQWDMVLAEVRLPAGDGVSRFGTPSSHAPDRA